MQDRQQNNLAHTNRGYARKNVFIDKQDKNNFNY